MKAIEIKHYPCELHVKSDNGQTYIINYDGMQGLYSKEDWLNTPLISSFNKESQEEILSALEATYNKDFFSEN